MAEYNKRYRDTVFRDYFNDEERLLSLCNALLGTDAAALKINTLEGTFFDRQKNDLSCVVENNFLVLVEHQSTINENMPFRCLSYVAELMNNLIEDKDKLYHKALIRFPAPRFYVFYDGDAKEPLQREMRLSDAFDGDNCALELVVTSLNINYGLNQPLLEKCRYLHDYSTLVGKVKEELRLGLTRKEAISRAVKFCIDNGIMGNYLVENSMEVFNMLALQWEQDKAIRASYEDGRDDGIESVAIKMIRLGKSFADISEITELPPERITELADKQNKKYRASL